MTALSRSPSELRHVAHEAAPWIARLARSGYAARAVLYATLGLLALLVAQGDGDDGKRLDERGALSEIASQPLGELLLGLVAVGLLGYAAWRFVQAALDPEHEARNEGRWKGAARRIGWAGTGIVHLGLLAYAIGLLTGLALGEGHHEWTAALMGVRPWGPLLVGVAGVGVVAFAGWQLIRAWRARLDEQLSLDRLSRGACRFVVATSRVGLAARGLVFAVVGLGLVVGASRHDAGHVEGLDQALRTIQQAHGGGVLLGAVAVGLCAYGFYELVEARYRRIQPV